MLSHAGDSVFYGNLLMIRRALSNLLSNAIRHTPPGGAVSVVIGRRRPGRRQSGSGIRAPTYPWSTCPTFLNDSTGSLRYTGARAMARDWVWPLQRPA